MRKNEDREFSWAWRIFVPVVAVAILGMVSITVPDSINVKVESNSVFGDFSNRTTDREDLPTLCVSEKCLFGKVEIDRQ